MYSSPGTKLDILTKVNSRSLSGTLVLRPHSLNESFMKVPFGLSLPLLAFTSRWGPFHGRSRTRVSPRDLLFNTETQQGWVPSPRPESLRTWPSIVRDHFPTGPPSLVFLDLGVQEDREVWTLVLLSSLTPVSRVIFTCLPHSPLVVCRYRNLPTFHGSYLWFSRHR